VVTFPLGLDTSIESQSPNRVIVPLSVCPSDPASALPEDPASSLPERATPIPPMAAMTTTTPIQNHPRFQIGWRTGV
jgi:hypothetical protein